MDDKLKDSTDLKPDNSQDPKTNPSNKAEDFDPFKNPLGALKTKLNDIQDETVKKLNKSPSKGRKSRRPNNVEDDKKSTNEAKINADARRPNNGEETIELLPMPPVSYCPNNYDDDKKSTDETPQFCYPYKGGKSKDMIDLIPTSPFNSNNLDFPFAPPFMKNQYSNDQNAKEHEKYSHYYYNYSDDDN